MDLFKHPTVRQLAALAGTPAEQRGPRRLLHELTRPLPDGQRPTLTLICVPYGGGSAVVYQPLADALPDGYRLLALAIPGHDIGVAEQHVAIEEIVTATVAEIAERVDGPVAVYGHCGIGSALAVALSLGLEATGRPVEAVYIGGVFPFARPRGRFAALQSWAERLRSDRHYANWLTSLGLDLNEIGSEQARALVHNLRKDNQAAEEYFTRMWQRGADRLHAPVISVVGERDDLTMFYEERFREWHFLSDTTALFVLDEAGHYFLKYRADELATILALPVDQLDTDGLRRPTTEAVDAQPVTWWLHDVSTTSSDAAAGPATGAAADAAAPPAGAGAEPPAGAGEGVARTGPTPSMRRFLGIAGTQMVSMTTSAVTGFAVPLWIYLETGSLVNLALFSAISLVPGMLVLPVAGVIVDRHSRRAVMLASDTVSGATQAALLLLVLTGRLEIWHIYLLLIASSVAVTFHRLAYSSAIPQLVPKRYLGHANGLVQLGNGVGQFLVPIAAVGILAAIGLEGILILDLIGFAVATTVLVLTRFPAWMAFRRRETMLAEIKTGFRYAMGSTGLRSMLLFFAVSNLFLGPLLILLQPLVLGFGTMRSVTEVAVAGGVGTIAGGVVMALWGGPVRRKMLGVLGAAAALAIGAGVAGLRPSVAVTAAGVFGLYAGLTVMNAIYATIVQVKVPARFHGRVFAVNTLFAFCTLPIGFIVIGPAVSGALNPLLAPDGALAGTVGRVIGTGEGRGIGLTYLLFGAAILLLVAAALRFRPLARFDFEVPDAEPDDLVGLAELRRRAPARHMSR